MMRCQRDAWQLINRAYEHCAAAMAAWAALILSCRDMMCTLLKGWGCEELALTPLVALLKVNVLTTRP